MLIIILSLSVVDSLLGHECGARQSFQQQAQETAETAEICRMFGQEGMDKVMCIYYNLALC